MIIKLDIPIPVHLKSTSVKNQLYILNVQVELIDTNFVLSEVG